MTYSFKSKRESYLRGFFYNHENEIIVKCLEKQDSSLIRELANSNCLIKIPRNSKKYVKNSVVEIMLMPQLF